MITEHDFGLPDGPHSELSARWLVALTGVSILGLAIRVVYVLVSKYHAHIPFNDSFYFHYQANLLVEGTGWFINPSTYFFEHHQLVQAADHPPMWTLVLAGAAAIGLKGYVSQLFWGCVVGAGAVFVTGLAGRRVAGPRSGIFAAGIAAVYPNYWLNDGLGMSETLVLLVIAVALLWSFRLLQRPGWFNAAALGFFCALGALTRSELALLVVLLLLPVCLGLRGISYRRRAALFGTGLLTALVTVSPWVGFNLSRFSHTELLSNELGVTLVCANNAATYHGHLLGYWQGSCTNKIETHGDESAQDGEYRHIAFRFIKHHEGRIPAVVLARVGRELGLFHPLGQIDLDHYLEYRPLAPAVVGLFLYYAMAMASIGGAVNLRRRSGGISLVPFIGIFIGVIVAAALTYGNTRFRTPFEVVLVVLTGVFLDAILAGRRLRLPGASPVVMP